MSSFRTKQRVQQRRMEEEKALDQKLLDETQQATISDDLERRQRKVEVFFFVDRSKCSHLVGIA